MDQFISNIVRAPLMEDPHIAFRAARNGTGWGLANVNVSGADGEYGWDGTAGTIFWIDPRREQITILMTQSAPPNPDSLRQEFKALVDEAGATLPRP